MRHVAQGVWAAATTLAILQLGGCPTGVPPLEFVAGGTGQALVLRDQASVQVLTPVSDLSITGGTQVEVNWQAFARTRTSVINVIIDEDTVPDNDNEIEAYSNLPLTQTSALVDTTRLRRGTYYLGVIVEEVGEIAAFGYAPGRIRIDQRPELYFTSPRGQFAYDRTVFINPSFEVSFELYDPDSVNTVSIYLDPDDLPNGNEVLLYESQPQTGQRLSDSFSFDLPTAAYAPGLYRILAVVSDGQHSFPFYGPGSIRLRSRLAGYIDLRDMHLPSSGISGAIFEGVNPRDNAGSFLASAEDIDVDGFNDIFIMAQFGKPAYIVNLQRTGIGEGYLIYGRPTRFSGVNNLNSTGTLFRGDIFEGVPEVPDPIRPSRGVTAFSVMTDWDNDGRREFAFGVPFTDSAPINLLDQAGYFRTGAAVVASGSCLRDFAGGNVLNIAYFGTFAVPTSGDEAECPEGFVGPKAPASWGGSTLYYRHFDAIVSENFLGCRIATVGFGDQCGEFVSTYPFFGGFT